MVRPPPVLFTVLGCLALTLVPLSSALAAWPSNPLVNLPISNRTYDLWIPRVLRDPAGNAIITWYGAGGIHAQRVSTTGTVDPAWPPDGLAVGGGLPDQNSQEIISDADSGAFITWYDRRNGTNGDIYAQRVLSNGTIAPGWPTTGLPISATPIHQLGPEIVSDGAGGAIVVWGDWFNPIQADIFAHHVLANGTLDPAWGPSGLPVIAFDGFQWSWEITSDGAGGAIVVWEDSRIAPSDIYAQRVRANGSLDPAWPANGRLICSANSRQYRPVPVPDGASGAIVAWLDTRNAGMIVCAQHLLANGSVDPAWPADGIPLHTAVTDTTGPSIASDGLGGAFVGWADRRSGEPEAYAHHVLANGVLDPAWPAEGRALSVSGGAEQSPLVIPDEAGGLIATWQRPEFGPTSDVFAARLTAGGALVTGWPSGGRPICTAAGVQRDPAIAPDGTGGAVITWMDRRGLNNFDIYAQRVDADGVLGGDVTVPTLLSLMSASVVPEGIEVRWEFGDPLAFHSAILERADHDQGPYAVLALEPRREGGGWTVLDTDVVDGRTYWYRLVAQTNDEGTITFGPISAIAAGQPGEFELSRVAPNPTNGPLRIEFGLPRDAQVRLDVLDVMGRQLATLTETRYPAGRHQTTWSGAFEHGRAAAGLYLLRMRVEGLSITRRVVITR